MICSCGGLTVTHELVNGTYERCPDCGRVEWTKPPAPKPDREEKGLVLT
jgi:hypothetical protein